MPDSLLDNKPRILADIQKAPLQFPNISKFSKVYVDEAKDLRDRYIQSASNYIKLLEKDGINDPEQLLRALDSASSFNELADENKKQVMLLLEKDKQLRSELPRLKEEASLIANSTKVVSDNAYEIFIEYLNDKDLTAVNSTKKLEEIVSKLSSDLESSIAPQEKTNLTHLLRISKQILEQFQVYDTRFESAMEKGFDIKKQFIQLTILNPTKESGFNKLLNSAPKEREFEFLPKSNDTTSIKSIYALLDRRASAVETGFYEDGKYNIWNAKKFFEGLYMPKSKKISSADVINTIRAADHLTKTGDVRLESTKIPSLTPRHSNIHTLVFSSQEDEAWRPTWMSFYKELKDNNSLKSAISSLLQLPQAEIFQSSVDFPDGIKNDPKSTPIIAFIITGKSMGNDEVRLTAEGHKDLLIEARPNMKAENIIYIDSPTEVDFNRELKTLNAKIESIRNESGKTPEIIVIFDCHGMSIPVEHVPKPFQDFQGAAFGEISIGKDFKLNEPKINEALKPIAEKARVFCINGACYGGAWLY